MHVKVFPNFTCHHLTTHTNTILKPKSRELLLSLRKNTGQGRKSLSPVKDDWAVWLFLFLSFTLDLKPSAKQKTEKGLPGKHNTKSDSV